MRGTDGHTRRYVPQVGARVKLRTWTDYTERGLYDHMWSWFRVVSTHVDTAVLQRLNGTAEESEPISVPLAIISPPIGWAPTYDIHVSPDKVATVLSWFARGIRVAVDHALDRRPGNAAFSPLDNPSDPTWGYGQADIVPADQCPNVFRVIAYVEHEFRMPVQAHERRAYRRAAATQGWTVRGVNCGAHGYVWYRSKGITAYEPGQAVQPPWLNARTVEYWQEQLHPPETSLDVLARLDVTFRTDAISYDFAAERKAIVTGEPIGRWILNRADSYLRGHLTGPMHGNSTWMFDPLAIGDPVRRTGELGTRAEDKHNV